MKYNYITVPVGCAVFIGATTGVILNSVGQPYTPNEVFSVLIVSAMLGAWINWFEKRGTYK
jgi:hypothetical protein